MSARRLGAAALLIGAALACAASLAWHPPVWGSLTPADPPEQRLDEEVTRQFGMELPIVWIVEARTGTVWSADVLERLQALTRAVFTLPGVMAPDVVSVASPNVREVRVTEGGLAPRYLMGEVPRDAAGIAALRARVDEDPMLRGNLVSLDGRAALVAANFRPDVDRAALGRAALALRDRFRDDVIQVWTVGAPPLAVSAVASLRARLPLALAGCLAAALAGVVLCSVRRVVAALSAATAVAAAAGAAASWSGANLPWGALSAAGALGITTVIGLHGAWPARAAALLALAQALALAVTAALAPPLLCPFFTALAVGVLLAPHAVTWARVALAVAGDERPRRWAWPSHVVALVVAGAALGAVRLDLRLDQFGYGRRYLPPPARADLEALARRFPPPASFAVRVRGNAGFVTRPEVLAAFEQVTATARRDPAVTSATSLADLVKRVHRAFNDDRPEFERLPDEPGLVGRYLALAYSPGFRRFVDRPLAATAIWVSAGSPAPAEVAGVHRTLVDALAAHPVPGAATDPPAGDAMEVLRASRTAAALARGGVIALLLAGVGFLPVVGGVAAAHAVAVAALSTAAAAGCLGWLGAALDLVTLPGLLAVGMAALLSAGITAAARRPANADTGKGA
jgi:hypothetical protein